jgi:hypothetical protein
MRNPIAEEEYNGSWADNDRKWTNHAKNYLGHRSGNDGTFWMPFNDYYRLFARTTVG